MKTRGISKNKLKGGSELKGVILKSSEGVRSTKSLFKDAEKKYKILFDNAPVGISIVDLNRNVVEANAALKKIAGISEKGLKKGLHKKRKYLYADGTEMPDDQVPTYLALKENRLIKDVEIGIIDDNNDTLWVQVSVAPLDEKSNMGVVITQDITEQKLAEEKLRTSETEYRSLFENSIMGISQVKPDGTFIRINKAYAEMYGYPDVATMMKRHSSSSELYSNPEDRKRVFEILDRSDYMPPTEFELIRSNGEKFWALVAAKPVKDNTGKLLYLQAEHFDITSRKNLENEMYTASLYARNLIEASPDSLVTINSDGKITDVNSSTEKTTGLTRMELIGTDFSNYFTDPAKAREGYKTVFLKGKVTDFPLTLRHTSSRTIDVLYNATLFRNEFGEVQGVFAAARDVTERKKMEEELRKSQELLEKLNQHMVDIIETERKQISLNLHDNLGQKLTAINLDIEWLKSRIGVQSTIVREKIKDMSQMIKETIENIREISSLLRPAILFDLGLVAAIKYQLNTFEKQSGIKCHFYYEPEKKLPNDRISLIIYRIVQESLTNIARHSGATEMATKLVILNTKVEVIITDNGIGISRESVNSLESMGIAGMKERVKLVNGKITLRGYKGSGTRIKVIIPI